MINLKDREKQIPQEFKQLAKDFSDKGFVELIKLKNEKKKSRAINAISKYQEDLTRIKNNANSEMNGIRANISTRKSSLTLNPFAEVILDK